MSQLSQDPLSVWIKGSWNPRLSLWIISAMSVTFSRDLKNDRMACITNAYGTLAMETLRNYQSLLSSHTLFHLSLPSLEEYMDILAGSQWQQCALATHAEWDSTSSHHHPSLPITTRSHPLSSSFKVKTVNIVKKFSGPHFSEWLTHF